MRDFGCVRGRQEEVKRMSRRQFLRLAALGASASAIVCGRTAKAVNGNFKHGGVFIQEGASVVQRTMQAKLRELPSVDDFGAIGDGKTDDRPGVQAALDWAGQ